MRTIHLGITALVAMAAGVMVGGFLPGAKDGVDGEVVRTSVVSTEPAASDSGANSFSGENPRQVKLFSALKEPLTLRKRFLVFEALQQLQPGDFKTVVDHVEKLPGEVSYELLPLLLDRWVKLDFAGAQEWLLARPGQIARAKVDPKVALQAVMTLTDETKASHLMPIAVQGLSGTPKEKLAQVLQFPAGRARDSEVERLLYIWAAEDPRAAFAAVDEHLSGAKRDEAKRYMMQRWAERDASAALEKLTSLLPTLKTGALGNEMVTSVIDKLPEKQVQLALDWVRDLPPELRSAAGIAVARKWAQKDPAAALEWCLENGVEPARGHRSGFGGWGAGVLGEAIEKKPVETVAWLEQLPAGPDRDRLSERALADSFWLLKKGEAFTTAESALLRLFAQLPVGAQVRTAHEFGERRAREGDLTDLQAWAQHFPNGAPRANAIAGAMSGAYERDASRVDSLMENLGTAADRDAALRGLAKAMEEKAPAEAAARAANISNAATRRETLEAVIVPWLKRDPTASREWLQNGPRGIPQSWTEAWLQAR